MKLLFLGCIAVLALGLTSDQVGIRIRSGTPSVGGGGGSSCDAANVAAGASNCPILDSGDFTYLGGFKTPSATSNGEYLYGAGSYITFNHNSGNTLFMMSYGISTGVQMLGEITIETPSTNSDVTTWNRSTFVQGLYDPVEGQNNLFSEGKAGGMVVFDPGSGYKLFGTTYIWYDASYEHTYSKYQRSLTTSSTSFNGFANVTDSYGTTDGWSSEYLGSVPTEWQAALGGDLFGGGCCLSIVSRHSFGPNVQILNSSGFTSGGSVTGTDLLGFTNAHPNLGYYEDATSSNHHPAQPIWGMATYITGAVMIPGTSSVLFVGSHGTGDAYYGCGTSNESWHGQVNEPGPYYVAGQCETKHWAYDLKRIGIGTHAYPYQYQAWIFDLKKLKKVKDGTTNPATGQPWKMWDIQPESYWALSDILERGDTEIRELGAAYDPVTKKLYISQIKAEPSGSYQTWPLIHVYQLSGF